MPRDPMTRTELYPEIEPYETGVMAAGGLHRIYWEVVGSRSGVPVLFLHGGPGAGANALHRRFFDPAHYRVLLFDQRGAGRSTPLAETRENTTQHLIGDIEALRSLIGVERWIVFGGSWGSTLALAYAETHPERCLALVLRGIFLCQPREVAWFVNGMGRFFPDEWRRFAAHIPETERGDLLRAYHKRLMNPDPAVHMPAARAWSGYEGACSTLLPSPETMASHALDTTALSLARLEVHYSLNNAFLPENALIAGVGRIRHIPGVIVQGRYDVLCPPDTADELRRAWPEAEYIVVPDAGHSAFEPGIRAHLVAAMERLKGVG